MTSITGISSMATKGVLAELARAFQSRTSQRVEIESVGGVVAAERVQAGEPFDVVVLAKEAMDTLLAAGHLVIGSQLDLMRSPVAIAVRKGAARPSIQSEAALKHAVQTAASIGISTGPSGVALTRLFERWGLTQELKGRIVTAPPGIPVGSLVARGEVALGFQQGSELQNLEGIEVLGTMPEPVRIVSTFSAAVGARAKQPHEAQALLAFFSSSAAVPVLSRYGMEPAFADARTGGLVA
jgi:molybdate transport system substrate-binding protein